MSALYESCGGCGAANPSERCFGCFHDFGPGLTAPSNANTSGLEVVGWIKRINERHPIGLTQPGDWRFTPHHPTLDESLKAEWFDIEPLVTAASAQARIDAAEAQADRLAKALETLEAERKREDVNLAHLKRAVAVAYADMNRAAIQQEKQP